MLSSRYCYQIPKLFHLSIKVPIAPPPSTPALSQSTIYHPSPACLLALHVVLPPQPAYLAALSPQVSALFLRLLQW